MTNSYFFKKIKDSYAADVKAGKNIDIVCDGIKESLQKYIDLLADEIKYSSLDISLFKDESKYIGEISTDQKLLTFVRENNEIKVLLDNNEELDLIFFNGFEIRSKVHDAKFTKSIFNNYLNVIVDNIEF